MKALRIVITILCIALLGVVLAGMYKFNYLAGQDGYDADGNKIIMDQQVCESQPRHIRAPQGKAQTPTCITTYADSGKECSSSDQCQGNCIQTSIEESATCEADNSVFGCKNTIENINSGEGILCVD